MSYIKSIFNLKDKVVALTGGTGVLAGEMAKGFLQAGSKVILLDRNEKSIEERLKEFSQISKEITAYKCDVLEKDMMSMVKEKILEKYGRLDVLVNAAGGNMVGATIGVNQNFFDINIDEFIKVTELNLNGTVLPTLILGKIMAEQKSGSIINISSMAASRAISRVVGYSTAKAAIENFTRWMAVELAQKFSSEIRVNAIAPGFLITKQNKSLLTNDDGSMTDRGKHIIKMTPFKRFGNPDEMVGAVLWLASDASKFVTGAVIPIDGGFSSNSGV